MKGVASATRLRTNCSTLIHRRCSRNCDCVTSAHVMGNWASKALTPWLSVPIRMVEHPNTKYKLTRRSRYPDAPPCTNLFWEWGPSSVSSATTATRIVSHLSCIPSVATVNPTTVRIQFIARFDHLLASLDIFNRTSSASHGYLQCTTPFTTCAIRWSFHLFCAEMS